jgi:hypothetical protein
MSDKFDRQEIESLWDGTHGCGLDEDVAADVAAGSTTGREEQGLGSQDSSLTACEWLRAQGVFRGA